MNKKIDIVLILLIVGHLLNRNWFFGSTLQTITDVCFGITAILIVYKWISNKK